MKYFVPLNKPAEKKSEKLELDAEFQLKIQGLFVKNNKNKFDEIIKAIDEGDIKTAHRLAHTLKGNAGQIGKKLLQQAAAVVENSLKDGENKTDDEQLKTLKAELDVVINGLLPLFEEQYDKPDEKKDVPKISGEKTRELINKLEPLLKSGNPQSAGLAKELLSIEGGEELSRRIDDFEFEAALSTLEKIKARME
jgi:HPt (histidine-containing phosphotransfer) domain-containing protein